jgi:glycosyltransferase involved in cell wall biosynthesis
MFKLCAVIPVYNHENAITDVVAAVIAHAPLCILVDDGSSVPCAQVLDRIAAAQPDEIILLRHAINRGKGGAVMTGMRHAARLGFSHALQIDADGQHQASDVPRFIEQARLHPDAVIVGWPEYDTSVPWMRYWARYLTHAWVWINTMSLQIKDSMCGFRVYPLRALLELDRRCNLGQRMNFDIEVLVRLYWQGIDVINVSTVVIYPKEGRSHFRGWLDNFLISRLHATLFFGMLWRLPMLITRKWSLR